MSTPRDFDELADFRDIPDFVNERPEATPIMPERPPALPDGAATRPQTRRQRWVAVAFSLAWLLVHLAVYGIRADLHELPLLYTISLIAVPFAFAASSLLLALSPGKLGLGLGLGAGLLVTVCVLGPLSFLLIAIGAPEPSHAAQSANLWLGMLVCLDITLAWAAVPLFCAALSLRRAFPSGARFRGGLVGAACGLFSGATMNLHCPNVDGAHVMLGHGIPVVIATLVGALVLARWSKA